MRDSRWLLVSSLVVITMLGLSGFFLYMMSPTQIEKLEKVSAILVPVAGLAAIAVAAWRSSAAQLQAETLAKQAATQARNVLLLEQGQVTERFTRAVEMLADDRLSVRLGGIYSLERIAKDSDSDHWTVMEVLCSYVRAWAPEPKLEVDSDPRKEPAKTSMDIQAILTVLGRRSAKSEEEGQWLDLSGANLSKANLYGANLSRVNLAGANLKRATLRKARLCRATLIGANLSKATLSGVDFSVANLSVANFSDAGLSEVDLSGANLSNTNLSKAKGLVQAQLDSAFGDYETRLPESESGLKRPEHWREENERYESWKSRLEALGKAPPFWLKKLK